MNETDIKFKSVAVAGVICIIFGIVTFNVISVFAGASIITIAIFTEQIKLLKQQIKKLTPSRDSRGRFTKRDDNANS